MSESETLPELNEVEVETPEEEAAEEEAAPAPVEEPEEEEAEPVFLLPAAAVRKQLFEDEGIVVDP